MLRVSFVRCAPLLVAGIVVTHAVAVIGDQAAQKPLFSGIWIIQPPNKAAGVEQIVKQDDKTELLIFVTPKIVKDTLSVR